MANPLTFDLGDFIITHPDDVCWTVQKRRSKPDKAGGGQNYRWDAVSHHGTLEDAIQNIVRLLADDKGAATLTEHVDNIRGVWAEMKQTVCGLTTPTANTGRRA